MFHHNEIDANNKACYTDLYDSVQRVRYRVNGRDDKLSLNVKVGLLLKCGFSEEKVMKVVITDDDNPLLLFTTEIDGEVYAKLKHKLGLLIDFSQFPHQLVNLLNQCSPENGGGAGSCSSSTSKYALVLEELAADPYDIVEGRCILFKIVEVNEFQRLCLVALHLVCGSEAEVNAFMARNVQLLRQQIERLTSRLSDADRRRATAEEGLGAKCFEVERVKMQANEQLKAMQRKCDDELQAAQRDSERLRADYERRLLEATHECEERHRGACAKLESAAEKRNEELKSLGASNARLERELSEKNETLDKLVDDIKMLQDELLKSENKIFRLEAEGKERNVFVVSLKQRVSQLERDKEDKCKAIKKLSSLLEAADASKTHLKTLLKEKLDLVDVQQEKVSALTKDLSKANEIIAKLTKDNKQLNTKLSERTKIALQQEKVIESSQANFSRSQQLVDEKSARIRQLESDVETLKSSLKSCEEDSKQKDDVIRKNERVIGWLNDIVSKQGTSQSSYVASRASSGASVSHLSVPEGSIDKKLLQLTINSNDSSKTNSTATKKVNRSHPMRSK